MNTGPSQQREMFVSDTRQSFGSTALVLHGGATFALYHFGVAKALFNNDLLPRIITGSSISALVAALICTHTDNDLPSIFDASAVKLEPFEKKGGGGYRRKLRRLLETGYILDAKVFAQVIEDNLGDSTFEEAFKKTKRILNITVNSKRKNEVPRLLNYLTAPTVLIRTAACASASSLGIFESTDLKAKMKDGTVVNWGSHNVKWTEANESHECDSPETRLAELFNVNHFIVSQSSPLATPFIPKGLQHRKSSFFDPIFALMFAEFRHRILQLAHFGFVPQPISAIFSQKFLGNVTITPALTTEDLWRVFSNPSRDALRYWILKGEKSTWPYLTLIRQRMSVELALDQCKQIIDGNQLSKKSSAELTQIWGSMRRSSLNF